MLSREEIRYGYLFVLGREPEGEGAYAAHGKVSGIPAFRSILLNSSEGQEKLSQYARTADRHPFYDLDRRTICFLHLEKTGGTTLYNLLRAYFPSDRVSLPHIFSLHKMAVSDINRYDLIAGHFDYESSFFIPRAEVLRVSVFREPVARLVSFYRFHRALPIDLSDTDIFVKLAHEMGPKEFFAHERVLSSPRLNNAYLRAFGTTVHAPVRHDEDRRELGRATDIALGRVARLTGLGLTERMTESVGAICKALAFKAPDRYESHHITRSTDQPLSQAEIDDLKKDVAPLIAVDQILYDFAKSEFERRLSEPERAGERRDAAPREERGPRLGVGR
jgi:hypothetical protein